MKTKFSILILSALFVFAACEDEEHGGNETNISSNFSDDSHKTGQDCMQCHLASGGGEGWFTVAGSVYNKASTDVEPNGIVKLTTESNSGGTVVATVEVDNKGNFYTTATIAFGDGLYVSVQSQGGTTQYMHTKITSGACNSCHGNSTDKIWVE